MGIGMGYAIGAAVVTGKPVVAIEGDSAFGFSGMEIETICRYNPPVVILVFNKGGIYHGDKIGSLPSPTGFVPNARYDKLIGAFGGTGYHVENTRDLATAVAAALATGHPAPINCVIDSKQAPRAGTSRTSTRKLPSRCENCPQDMRRTRQENGSTDPVRGPRLLPGDTTYPRKWSREFPMQPTWIPHTEHGRLTARSELPDTVFAFPNQRKEPLTDAEHVRDAAARFDQVIDVSDEDRALAFANIEKAAEYYSVNLSETSWRDLGVHPQRHRKESAAKGVETKREERGC